MTERTIGLQASPYRTASNVAVLDSGTARSPVYMWFVLWGRNIKLIREQYNR